MTERVISATFSTWRPVNGRKVLQLVFEVPIEQQGEVLTMLGAPDDKWCAIALLNEKPKDLPAGSAPVDEAVPRPRANEAGTSTDKKDRRPFSSLSLTAQAGMRCEEETFFRFLSETRTSEWNFGWGLPHNKHAEDVAAWLVRKHCRVTSRAELSTDHNAANKWRELNAEFEAWQLDQKYAEVRR